MKRLLTLLLVVGLVVCGASLATAQNILTNPNLDATDPGGTQQFGATPTDWIVAATRGADLAYLDGVASEGFANHNAGGTSGLFFKAFTGNPPWDPTAGDVDCDVYQDNPGIPGKSYHLTGWAGAEANYSGLHTAGANSILALDFLDGIGGLISSAELDLEAAGLGQPGGQGSFNWRKFTVSAVAPGGTATVRARASMVDGVFFQDPGQAYVVDQLSLVPEPASVMLVGLAVLGLVGLRRRSS